MKQESTQLITTRNKVIVLTMLSLVLYYVLSYVVNPYSSWWRNYFSRPVIELIYEFAVSVIFSAFISLSSIYVHATLNKWFPWIEMPRRRLLLETAINVALVLLFIFTQMRLWTVLSNEVCSTTGNPAADAEYWEWVTVSILIALAISAIHTGDYLINNWKNAALEAAEHKLESIQQSQAAAEAELQALKLQLDPHFVFNNLSVLSELILEDQQLGYNYAENFAKVYRFLLLNSRKDLITLEEELKFVRAYIFLLEQRAGAGIAFKIEIDTDALGMQLPPLTLQLLIENAMKHNKVLKTNPLLITIENSGQTELIVTNTLMPLEKKPVSAGVGLKNIIRRYRLLSDREPVIKATDDLFTVTLPLIGHDK